MRGERGVPLPLSPSRQRALGPRGCLCLTRGSHRLDLRRVAFRDADDETSCAGPTDCRGRGMERLRGAAPFNGAFT